MMGSKRWLACLALMAAMLPACSSNGDLPLIAVIVDPGLASSTAAARSQFIDDLGDDGFDVVETTVGFATPEVVRAYLQGIYDGTGLLVGAFLIGDVPHAYQWVTLSGVGEEAVSYQYYSDLDGEFTASPGYISPGGHDASFDIHSGAFDWEIWVGVLPLHNGDYVASATAINGYLARNHAYRQNPSTLPRAFLQVTEHHSAETMQDHNMIIQLMATGQYSWTPWSADPAAMLYFDSPPGGMSVADGYAALSGGAADFFVGGAHGSWLAHGDLTVSWVQSNPVQTAFFWSDGCSVANLDMPGNFLTEVLYDPSSTVVAAKGTTNNSGGLGTNADGFFGHNIATAMAAGHSLGEALVSHVNVPLEWPWSDSREFHFGTVVILGDPSLGVPTSAP